ncbi:MAG: hypothetical protein ABIE68_05030 [bacterium]
MAKKKSKTFFGSIWDEDQRVESMNFQLHDATGELDQRCVQKCHARTTPEVDFFIRLASQAESGTIYERALHLSKAEDGRFILREGVRTLYLNHLEFTTHDLPRFLGYKMGF